MTLPLVAMTPLQIRYNRLNQKPDFESDPCQQRAIIALDALGKRILSATQQRFQKRSPGIGLWLWGPVGRGKTLLMDLFFETLPEPNKRRLHFHHFMRRVHEDLNRLAGHPDPLTLIANQLRKTTLVLCFDEFFVADIADAMLLGRLFEKLFEQGIFLIATSNQHPDQLYSNGLQRQRFLPAITAIKKHCQIHSLDGEKDHRLRTLATAQLFLKTSDPQTHLRLKQHFQKLGSTVTKHQEPLSVLGRQIPCQAWNEQIAWFNFVDLCEGPRSQLDYMELADRFHTLIVSQIPSLRGDKETLWVVQGTEDKPASATNQRRFLGGNDDNCRRFISLIDELYDRAVVLIASSEIGIDQLYPDPDAPLAFAFARTRSRLKEMQSENYLQRCKGNNP